MIIDQGAGEETVLALNKILAWLVDISKPLIKVWKLQPDPSRWVELPKLFPDEDFPEFKLLKEAEEEFKKQFAIHYPTSTKGVKNENLSQSIEESLEQVSSNE